MKICLGEQRFALAQGLVFDFSQSYSNAKLLNHWLLDYLVWPLIKSSYYSIKIHLHLSSMQCLVWHQIIFHVQFTIQVAFPTFSSFMSHLPKPLLSTYAIVLFLDSFLDFLLSKDNLTFNQSD